MTQHIYLSQSPSWPFTADKEQNRLASPARRASLTWPSPAQPFVSRSLSFLLEVRKRETHSPHASAPRPAVVHSLHYHHDFAKLWCESSSKKRSSSGEIGI
jgi:hypothetical protein